ncbi:MAG: hypothetical protein ACR2GY_13010 [Phycisphaerales bacterium]
MARFTGATNTQKTLLISLHDGWLLRYVDEHGWCLFQPNRARPFAKVKERTVDTMTNAGWFTPGTLPQGLGYRPAKDLTPEGRKYAEQLVREEWAASHVWYPQDAGRSEEELEGDSYDVAA